MFSFWKLPNDTESAAIVGGLTNLEAVNKARFAPIGDGSFTAPQIGVLMFLFFTHLFYPRGVIFLRFTH